MSRCFPYPPPGYGLSKASNQALIESIKLQKEREKAKAERKKEKKREKDEKKKSKKEKEKSKLNAGHDAHEGKNWVDTKAGCLLKERKDDTDQVEQSSITEEHGPPQNPSYSSDSTENSNKRKRHTAALNNAKGNILRIRLPSQKAIQCDHEKLLCSTSGRRELVDTIDARSVPDKSCSNSVKTASVPQALPPLQAGSDLRHSNSDQTPIPSQQEIHSGDHVSKRFKKRQKVVRKYSALIENWIPPSQEGHSSDAEDQEWLFGGRKQQQKQTCPDSNHGVVPQMSCSTSASLWPSAQYLSGADIYALPYTIPF